MGVRRKVVRVGLVVLAVLVGGSAGLYVWSRVSPTEVVASVEIEASAERVWGALTDFESYPDWNPFIVRADGQATVDSTLRNTLVNNGSRMDFEPTVLVADPERELRWIGRFGMPGIVDGEHYFLIEPIGLDRVRFTQGETFTGILVPVAGGSLDVKDGFAAMNSALKSRLENAE
jgi:hypothetical protein